ncbi:O-antigen ligase family protein [Acidimangrovimonas sediminis]|uniref:O-antigen ligase family protein n=1 Tax=Acidimangrovimonas sediminis TaxID=2056283 RepID=UPI0013048A25|nr:O-antigen ligase family protein [Acidimangrovimonas sediminis]
MAAIGAPDALVLVLGAGVVWVGFMRPTVLVAAYAAIVFSNAADVATDTWHLPPIGATLVPLLLLLLLLRLAVGHERPEGALVVLPPVALYLFGRAWSMGAAPDTELARAAVVELSKDLLILVIFAGFLTTLPRLRATVAAAAAAIGLIAALSVVQYATHGFEHSFGGFANAVTRQIVVGQSDGWRLTGPLPDANFYGQLLVLGLPLVAVFSVIGRGRAVRALAVAGVLAVLVTTVFTYSRGALVGMAGVGVGVLAVLWLGGRRSALYLGTGAVALGGLAAVVLPAAYLERVSQMWQAGWSLLTGGQFVPDPALAERLSVIRAALYMFTENPLMGVGIGQFKSLYPEIARRHGLDPGAPGEAHNLYLETLAEGGLLGLGLFALLVGTALVLALRARRRLLAEGQRDAAALVAAIVLSTAGFLFTSTFLHGAYQRFLWLDVALLFSAWSAVRLGAAADSSSLASRRPSMNNDRDFVFSVTGLLARSWPVILIFALAGAGIGLWQVNRTPRSFEAQTTLIYRFGREYFPVAPGEQRRDWGANVMMTLDNALFTEMRLLTAHDLYVQTAATVWPSGDLGAGDAPTADKSADKAMETATNTAANTAAGMPKRMTADQVSDAFRVTRVQGATMVTVSARSVDPAVADLLLNTQVAAYLDRRRSLFEQDSQGFFDGRIADLRTKLAALSRERETLLRTAAPGTAAEVRLQKISNGTTEDAAPQSKGDDAGALARTLALQPVETRISELNNSLSLLVKERDARMIESAFRKEVSPVVEVADERPAEGNPVGPSAALRIATSAVASAVVAALLILLFTIFARALPSHQPARRGEGA